MIPNSQPDISELETAFLDCWKTIQKYGCDLKKLPLRFAEHSCLSISSLELLLIEAKNRSMEDPLREAFELILKMITSNGGIALQMWCSNIAWLKRRLFNCVGKYPKEMELARRAASLEELFLPPQLTAPLIIRTPFAFLEISSRMHD